MLPELNKYGTQAALYEAGAEDARVDVFLVGVEEAEKRLTRNPWPTAYDRGYKDFLVELRKAEARKDS